MKKLMFPMLLLMVAATGAWGGTCYLRNGDAIDCERIWRKNGTVHIQVNRDTVLEFDAKEVDLEKSKAGTAKKKGAGRKKQNPDAATPKHRSAANAVTARSETGAAGSRTPLEGDHVPAEGAMAAALTGLRAAAVAGDIEGVKKYMAEHHRQTMEKLQRQPADTKTAEIRKRAMAELVPAGFTVVGSRLSRDGRKGMLRLRKGNGTGFVTLVQEGKEWKVYQQFWGLNGSIVQPPELD